jgi:hypothetical protein
VSQNPTRQNSGCFSHGSRCRSRSLRGFILCFCSVKIARDPSSSPSPPPGARVLELRHRKPKRHGGDSSIADIPLASHAKVTARTGRGIFPGHSLTNTKEPLSGLSGADNGALSQATASSTRGVGLMGVNAGPKGGLESRTWALCAPG